MREIAEMVADIRLDEVENRLAHNPKDYPELCRYIKHYYQKHGQFILVLPFRTYTNRDQNGKIFWIIGTDTYSLGGEGVNRVIGRTEKVQLIREEMKQKQIVYLSGFFYSGKTELLHQLAETLTDPVLRFDGEKDDWSAFEKMAHEAPTGVLLIDSLNQMDSSDTEKLKMFLPNLFNEQKAVLAGRGQLPEYLHGLYANGLVTVLDVYFVLFDEEEIRQLFLSYGIALKSADISFLKTYTGGWPTMLHSMAGQLRKNPQRPLRELREEVYRDLWPLLIQDVVMALPEQERLFLLNLSPFDRFGDDMARMVTGRLDAPRVMDEIVSKSWFLLRENKDTYAFIPFVRKALFNEMRSQYSQDYINSLYRRAALYCELQRDIPKAISFYVALRDTEKVRTLLINDIHLRPSNGDYAELRPAYVLLSEEEILASPELMKGMCMLESLSGHIEESKRWYGELEKFLRATPARDGRYIAAQEAIAYLDIGLAYRGTAHILQTLLATAKMKTLTESATWKSGFNVAGNSVSLLNGGKDFCRWVPHGKTLYRLFKTPIEMALGRGGSGMADIAIGECELESSQTGDYAWAMDRVMLGLSHTSDDLEMQCAALGIQSRILAAQGSSAQAAEMVKKRIASLPADAPTHLKKNFTVHLHSLRLLTGETDEALSWLATDAPDENSAFSILDRYAYMLKLRLYIITGQWEKTAWLTALLRNYFDSYDRPYMRCQLHLLQAIIDKRQNLPARKKEMEAAVSIARRYHLVRVIADEGIAALGLLDELNLPDAPWENAVKELTRSMAAQYPHYLKPAVRRPTFSDKEYMVYSLLITGVSTAEIARILNMKERTVKYYLTNIYQTLGVKTRSEALKYAAELGDM